MTEGAQHTLANLCRLALRELRLNSHRLDGDVRTRRTGLIAQCMWDLDDAVTRERAATRLVRMLAGTEPPSARSPRIDVATIRAAAACDSHARLADR